MYYYTKFIGGEWNILISKLKGFINTTLFNEVNKLASFYKARE